MGKVWRGLGATNEEQLKVTWRSLIETENLPYEWWVPRHGMVEDPVDVPAHLALSTPVNDVGRQTGRRLAGHHEPTRFLPGRLDRHPRIGEPRRQVGPGIAVLDRRTEPIKGVEVQATKRLAPVGGHGKPGQGPDAGMRAPMAPGCTTPTNSTAATTALNARKMRWGIRTVSRRNTAASINAVRRAPSEVGRL